MDLEQVKEYLAYILVTEDVVSNEDLELISEIGHLAGAVVVEQEMKYD